MNEVCAAWDKGFEALGVMFKHRNHQYARLIALRGRVIDDATMELSKKEKILLRTSPKTVYLRGELSGLRIAEQAMHAAYMACLK